MIEMVAPGSPPLGGHRGLTVRPRVGTALAAVSRPGWGGEARGGEGRGRGEPPRGGAGAREPPWGGASAAPKGSSRSLCRLQFQFLDVNASFVNTCVCLRSSSINLHFTTFYYILLHFTFTFPFTFTFTFSFKHLHLLYHLTTF